MRVTVVGSSSFIARALRAQPETRGWNFIGYQQARESDAWLIGTDVVVSCALDPEYKREPYTRQHDVDVQLAERLQAWPTVRYVMLSSRLAYGPAPADARLVETLAPQPTQPYGRAKWMWEQALQCLLGERLMVLRLSNIFGAELQPGRRNFLAMALRSLHERRQVVLDMSPFVVRDFLPVDVLAAWLPRMLAAWQPGLFNIGAGQGLAAGRIAQWLIEGLGQGELLVTHVREHDAFWLDTTRAQAAFQIPVLPHELIRDRCRALGAELRAMQDSMPAKEATP
jgi:UDP-glucose 4-epimerase